MQGSQKKNLSGNFRVAVDANQLDILGLSCLINTCYDEKKNTITWSNRGFKGIKIRPIRYWRAG